MNTPGQPLVSVVTPVYNGEQFLAECIESVLYQTYTNLEYIIVNNCSTDRSLDIASEYGRRDPRLRIRTNRHFVGVMENHNIALRLISPLSKYCKVLCADDFLFSDFLARIVEFGEANPSVGIIGSYQLSGAFIRWQGFEYPRTVWSGREICRRILLGDQVFVRDMPIVGFGDPTSLMYRADLVRSQSEWYPNSSPHADTSACFQALREADFGFVYQVLSYERVHDNTQSSKSAELNRILPRYFRDLLEYGPSYLTEAELDRRTKDTLRGYYRFLAVNYFVGSRGKEFWDFHRRSLEELGFAFSFPILLKMGFTAALREIANPGIAISRLRRRLAARFPRMWYARSRRPAGVVEAGH
jgi:glycosyltransferase involved in cell wall biosynthesis